MRRCAAGRRSERVLSGVVGRGILGGGGLGRWVDTGGDTTMSVPAPRTPDNPPAPAHPTGKGFRVCIKYLPSLENFKAGDERPRCGRYCVRIGVRIGEVIVCVLARIEIPIHTNTYSKTFPLYWNVLCIGCMC